MEQHTEEQIPLKMFPDGDSESQALPFRAASLKEDIVSWLNRHNEILFKLTMTLVVCLILLYFTLIISVDAEFITNNTIVVLLQKYINFTVWFCGGVMILGSLYLVLFGIAWIFACIWSQHSITESESPLYIFTMGSGYILAVTGIFSFLTMLQAGTQVMVGSPPSSTGSG